MDKEMFLIAGLGNPGDKYAGTRHNMGFDTVDSIYAAGTFTPWKKAPDSLIATGRMGGEDVMLVKPQKFMNLSGEALQAVMAYYKIPLHKLIVIYDDIDLATGQLRVRPFGGAGTHNGMRNILLHLGEKFMRVRVGVGAPAFGDLADYVLGKPKGEERMLLDQAIGRAAECAEKIVTDGIERAMMQFNQNN